jgi:hypothetical protein
MRQFVSGTLLALVCTLGGLGLSQAKADPIPAQVVNPCTNTGNNPTVRESFTPVAWWHRCHRFHFWRYHRYHWRHGC